MDCEWIWAERARSGASMRAHLAPTPHPSLSAPQDTSGAAANDFWNGEAQWAPSWASGSPFIIDSVSIWQDPSTAGNEFVYRPM